MAQTRLRREAVARDPRMAGGVLAGEFGLDPGVCFLNHGSFGATPRAVIEEERRWRARLEREPVRWFVEDLEPELDAARAKLAAYVGCPADDLAMVENATAGVSTVVRSLAFAPGDEIVSSAQEYNASNNALRHAAERWGARIVEAALPWPVVSEDELFAAVMRAVSERTRLVLVSHVTSPTAVVMPVERIARALAERGIDTLVDGAHAPGYLALNVAGIGCAYYTGNFHKWTCGPKGSAFLYVRPDRQERIRPLAISHGANAERTDRSRFRLEFDYIGSLDYAPWLATPASIELVGKWMGGWEAWRREGAALARRVRGMLRARLGGPELAPEGMVGFMGTAWLPDRRGDESFELAWGYGDPLWERLVARWGVQVPIISFPGAPRRHVRFSVGPYNRWEQYEYLADALEREVRGRG